MRMITDVVSDEMMRLSAPARTGAGSLRKGKNGRRNQNRYRRLNWICLGLVRCEVILPKLALFIAPVGSPKLTVFGTLKNSVLNSRAWFSVNPEFLRQGHVNTNDAVGIGNERSGSAKGVLRWQDEGLGVEPFFRGSGTGVGIAHQIRTLARTSCVGDILTRGDIDRRSRLKPRDAL